MYTHVALIWSSAFLAFPLITCISHLSCRFMSRFPRTLSTLQTYLLTQNPLCILLFIEWLATTWKEWGIPIVKEQEFFATIPMAPAEDLPPNEVILIEIGADLNENKESEFRKLPLQGFYRLCYCRCFSFVCFQISWFWIENRRNQTFTMINLAWTSCVDYYCHSYKKMVVIICVNPVDGKITHLQQNPIE